MKIMTDNLSDMCARAYIEYYRYEFKKYAWAAEYGESLIQGDSKAGLDFVLNVLSLCKNEQEIAYVGSGALEDLLQCHIFEVKGDIKNILQKNEVMRSAMRYVWAEKATPVNEFLIEINIKFSANLDEKRSGKSDQIQSNYGDE